MSYSPRNTNGQATSANSGPVALSTEQEAKIDLLATKAKQDLLLAELQLKADLTETQPVSGTLTVNAGTNLNTSTLALETGGNLAIIKTNTDKIPALGQALAAASSPVVLTAAQLITLTPPAAITGFSTEATLALIKNTDGIKKITDALPAGTNNIGDVDILTLPAEGVVSAVNSTIVNLAASAVFTGTSEDLTIYSNIKVSVFSSHVSATDGLSIQQSSDGTNWDGSDVYSIPAATYKTFSVAVNSKFFRIVYTNGATLTTSLRIQVLYNKSDKQASSVRPQDARANDNDFIEQLCFLMGYNSGTNTWDRLRTSIANGLAVDVTRMPTTAVTGTFFQTTQPVSGTFFQATQPVSLATNTPDVTDRAARLLGVLSTGANTIGAVNIAASQTITVTQATAGNLNMTATPIAITKSTQGATGFTTQDLKDAGRSARTIFLDSFAVAATAETLMTMSYSTDNATVTTGTTYPVTAAKRLRIQTININLHTIAGNTTAVNVIVRIRVNNAGNALVSSPVQLVIPVQGIAAANQASIGTSISIPDNWEFVAGAGIAFTVACSGFVTTTAAPKVDISVIGYEY